MKIAIDEPPRNIAGELYSAAFSQNLVRSGIRLSGTLISLSAVRSDHPTNKSEDGAYPLREGAANQVASSGKEQTNHEQQRARFKCAHGLALGNHRRWISLWRHRHFSHSFGLSDRSIFDAKPRVGPDIGGVGFHAVNPRRRCGVRRQPNGAAICSHQVGG